MTNRLSALIERARSHKPITALTLIGVLLLPAILGGVLVAALQDPTQRLDTMTAAIVNDDEPVTVNGQLAPLGRQLSAGLVDGTGKKDENLTWVVSNEKDAAAGLKDGTYQAVVRIPKGFSAAAVSGGSAVQDPSKPAEKATISVTTAPQARAADGLIANQIAATAASTMGTEISQSTLKNVLVGFGTLGDKIGEAADGADKLANGAKSAATGAAALPDGATKLADGAGQLADGASQLSNGLGTIANGITAAQTGANKIGAGLSQGADALETPGRGVTDLIAGANQTAQVAGVTSTGVDGLKTGLDDAVTMCNAATQKDLCALLKDLSGTATAIQPAATGAAAGSASVASGVTPLAALPGQFRAAADGVNQLSDGLGRLADGTTQSATGAGNLATGATGLQSGATQLADGATQLSTGVGSLATGTAGLATGLHQAADSLPKRTDSQASSLAEVVADPVKADTSGGMFGPTAIPLLAAVVLWFGGLVSFLVMRAFTARALTSRRPSALLALRAFAPAAALGAGQGLLVALVVEVVAKYDPARWWGFAGVAVLAGVAFAAVNQALVAVLGGIGRWIAAVIGVAALGAGIISTLPGWLATIAGALPTSPAATALLGDQGTGSAVAALVVWTVLALVATTLAVTARRTTSTRAILAPAV
ncbi:putative membrane protein [Microbacterium azadirachtae]|uniref:Putative membrane protein n=1 Tax=Microbacterium azadirachtae TaxID=582680 RepID=A0A1I6J7X9_9MICO|nr:YhgE/Pip family protein [Microbacterium azadirachtae]SFR75075.1 putative membrane protein [Microbacterium azadirachtae]